jgi:hypothetical protein
MEIWKYEYEYWKKNERNKLKIKKMLLIGSLIIVYILVDTRTREHTSADAVLFPVPLPTRIFKFQT